MGRIKQSVKNLKRAVRSLRKTVTRIRKAPFIVRMALLTLVLVGSGLIYTGIMGAQYVANYTPLLDTIGRGESRGNYEAYYGNASNSSVLFTSMTLAQVLQWQADFLSQGQPSSAVGKYQILRPTLLGLVQQLKLNPDTTYFDASTQDRLAVALIVRRGAHDYLRGRLSEQQFAANLAMEWASLPKGTGSGPDQSYYAGDGLNKSQVSIAEVYQALALVKPEANK